MKRIAKILLVGGVAAAAFVALLAALLLLMPGSGEEAAQASGGAGDYTKFGFDMDPYNDGGNGPLLPVTFTTQCACYPGEPEPCACESGAQCLNDTDDDWTGPSDMDYVVNDGCGLPSIDYCIRVDSGTFKIDVFVDDIPTGKDLLGFDYFLNYDNTLLQVNSRAAAATTLLLRTAPGSSVTQGGNTTWPHTTGSMPESAADGAGAPGGEPAGSLGPLERYELEVIGAGPAITALTFTPAPKLLSSNIPTPHGYDPDEVFDGTHLPAYGLVAIGQDCSEWVDSDGDTIPDSEDNCPYDPNPLQENHDDDGAGDACDPDDDNGGTPDNQELRDGTDPWNSGDDLPLDMDDDDNDMALNWEEDWVGTDPFDPCSDDCQTTMLHDAWAYDINNDCWCSAVDILMFVAYVNMPAELGVEPTYSQRYDLTGDTWINSTDMLTVPHRIVMPDDGQNPPGVDDPNQP